MTAATTTARRLSTRFLYSKLGHLGFKRSDVLVSRAFRRIQGSDPPRRSAFVLAFLRVHHLVDLNGLKHELCQVQIVIFGLALQAIARLSAHVCHVDGLNPFFVKNPIAIVQQLVFFTPRVQVRLERVRLTQRRHQFDHDLHISTRAMVLNKHPFLEFGPVVPASRARDRRVILSLDVNATVVQAEAVRLCCVSNSRAAGQQHAVDPVRCRDVAQFPFADVQEPCNVFSRFVVEFDGQLAPTQLLGNVTLQPFDGLR